MSRTIRIEPVTRLEGHGSISIFLDDDGAVERALLQVPELRGFEAFCVGRPAEEMPQITSRICGICPAAHHIAATNALDDLYSVTPPPAARAIRDLFYHLFLYEDHVLHFYYLGGADLLVDPDSPAAKRNILGVIEAMGKQAGKRVIEVRKRARDLMAALGGKPVHPVLGLPGGVAKAATEEIRAEARAFAPEAIEFARYSIDQFMERVLGEPVFRDLLFSEAFREPTHSMGMVDDDGRVSFTSGVLRVVDPEGNEVERFAPREYADVIAEHVEEWTYMKFPYLRRIGWKGFVSGAESGILRVAPLARLNVATGLSTPLAQAESERMFEVLGGRPAHHTLGYHWARLIEVLHAAERIAELAEREELTSPDVRCLDLNTPKKGVGVVEAPRGTLIHDYETDERGVITAVNLVVATLFNAASISMSIERAARDLLADGEVNEKLLNRVEMALRAYDPCLSCATHYRRGDMPLTITFHDAGGRELGHLARHGDGSVETTH